ncbi:MAG: TonB-dependent receptor [Flavobacteriaceae bacterium]|nr:TonB-dependent receptor [Flavobacteriaceae bacterium]
MAVKQQGDRKINKKFTTKQKALKINLNENIYGTFSEIGAGQETVRYFFQAGAASKTIAKAMSAYDKVFSDTIYGVEEDGRYVTEKRLRKMLRHETNLLEERLVRFDPPRRLFFSYANTVTTIDFAKKFKGHGWIGVRFQTNPIEDYNEIVIHIKFNQNEAKLQQETLGMMGVNLIYGAYYLYDNPKELILSLYDNLDMDKIEIDMIHFSGPQFSLIDNRLMSLYLLKYNITDAVMFDPNGNSLLPAQELFKKNILLMRGSFRPVTKVNMDLFEKSKDLFFKEPDVTPDNTKVIFEITLQNLRSLNEKSDEDVDDQDFLNRAELLCSLGHNVMITDFKEYYKLIDFISVQSSAKIGLAMGTYNLMMIFDEQYYGEIPGGFLEAIGRLMNRDTKFYLYPLKNHETGEITTVQNVQIPEKYRFLFEYFKAQGRFVEITEYDVAIMDILTRNVYKMIQNGEKGWEVMLPIGIAELIKRKKLFKVLE